MNSTNNKSKSIIGQISPETSALFICDIQSKFESSVHRFKSIAYESKYMMKLCKELNIPIIVTEQYPKALGKSSELISEEFEENKTKLFDKTLYSMYTPLVKQYLNEHHKNLKSIMLAGIDGNVCVFQTCLDLLEQGYDVHIIENAVTSSTSHERSIALKRLKQSGAFIISSETLFYQLTKDGKHEKFKTITNLILERRALISKL